MPYVQANGVSLHYTETGTGPDVLLLPGLGMSTPVWYATQKALSGSLRVTALDHRGHGASEKSEGPYSMRLFAEDAAAAARELDLAPAIVVASSMACMVAVEFAVAYPDSVAALVLVGGFPTLPPAGKERFEERARLVESEGLEAVVDAVIGAGFAATTHVTQPGLVGLYRDLLLRNESSCYAAACRAIARADVTALLPKVDHPTLILIGAEEHVAPLSAARALKDGISHAMLRVLPAAGHLPFLEQPGEFNAALQQFIGLMPSDPGPAASGRRLGFT